MNISKGLPLQETLANLPAEWPEDPLPDIRQSRQRASQKLVVVDDDPTGSQMVYGIPVLTEWPVEILVAELQNDLPAFYLLTNTRGLPQAEACEINLQIGRNLRQAARQANRQLAVVSRGDSTLRGHFPAEMQALVDGLQESFDAWLLVPALPEEGRFTLDDIHYVTEGERLVPIGETAYAGDATFGFHSSNLRQWVEEKTAGKVPAEAVSSISLAEIRRGGPAQVAQHLLDLSHGSICIVNAASRRDLEVFTLGLLEAEAGGQRFICRSGPSFIPAWLGLSAYPLLTCQDIPPLEGQGGLIVVGSYVLNTNRQVEILQQSGLVSTIQVDVPRLLDPHEREDEVARVAALANDQIENGKVALVVTSRSVLVGATAAQSLEIVHQVSVSLIAIVQAIPVRPRYVLAKGGITSHDIATRGLGVHRAMVLGQVAHGVSVWQMGPESRWPGMIYVVFPGNIGHPETLAEVVEILES